MRLTRRYGFTLIELLVATLIVGILARITIPIVMGVRQGATARRALVELRAVDVALAANCGGGTCGPYTDSGSTSSVLTTVPASLKALLPAGFVLSHDSTTYAVQLETWTVAPVAAATPVCVGNCNGNNGNGNGNNGNGNGNGNNGNGNGNGNNGNGNGNGGSNSTTPATPVAPANAGYTNTAGATAASTVYVNISVVTRNGAIAQTLYSKAGGTPPVYVTNGKVWKYVYPALVAVPTS